MPRPPSENPRHGFKGRGPTLLPAGGRTGPPPEWPIPGKVSEAEAQAWAALWATPHAVAWERLGWTRTVARYARMLVEAERPKAITALRAQLVVLEDRLGLTPKAMRLLLWQIAADEVAEKRSSRSEEIRRRIKAVEAS